MTTRTAFDAKTLERRYYVGEDVYEQETERIFFDRWLYAGRASEIAEPGAYMLFEIESESVIVLRDHEGAIHAHHNVCRHRGTRLVTEPTGNRNDSLVELRRDAAPVRQLVHRGYPARAAAVL